jgi:HPt (histidine-containing phosphotransfer) domain-containing protein
MAQANWVSSSTSIDKLHGTLNVSIADAQKTFANLAESTPKQKKLWAQLDQIDEKIKQAKKQ